jgi:hypothetical protein
MVAHNPGDKVFGSLGNAFQHKWMGSGYAHLSNPTDFQKALHWARLAAQHDPLTLTLLITLDPQWYQNSTPLLGPFLDTHTIIHFEVDTITYKEPTILIELNHHSRKEASTLHVYCIHHRDVILFNTNNIQQLLPILNTLNILNTQTQEAQPTPPNIQVNHIFQWDTLTYPSLLPFTILLPSMPTYNTDYPLKFSPEFSYCTDGSFVPPKEQDNGFWTRETSSYGIFNSPKNIAISKRLLGLQNILHTELTAIHHPLTLINANFPMEHAYIFTDSLNSLFLLHTQIQKPTSHLNHPDKVMSASIVSLMQNRTQPLFLHKVRAHFNIFGNDKADELAKAGNDLSHRPPISDYEHAHSTPYYLHKNWWHSITQTPYKGPI